MHLSLSWASSAVIASTGHRCGAFEAFDALVVEAVGVDVLLFFPVGLSFRFTTKLAARWAHPFSVIKKSCMPKDPSPAA